MAKAPCKDCVRRKLLCHGFCQEYQVFKEKLEEARKEKRKEQDTYCPIAQAVRYQLNRESRYRRNN